MLGNTHTPATAGSTFQASISEHVPSGHKFLSVSAKVTSPGGVSSAGVQQMCSRGTVGNKDSCGQAYCQLAVFNTELMSQHGEGEATENKGAG